MATKKIATSTPKGSKAAALQHAQKITHRGAAGQFKPPPGARNPALAPAQLPSPQEFEPDEPSYDPEEDLPYGA